MASRFCDREVCGPARSYAAIGRHGAGRWRSAAILTMVSLALTWSAPARASPSDPDPWSQGTIVPTLGLGAGGFFDEITRISLGLGLSYFVVHGLSIGLSVSDTILIYRSTLKARYPGIEETLPTNILSATPQLHYVFFRSRRFSPYVRAGTGPVFFNHGGGVLGQWSAGPGLYVNVTGPLYINFSVGFSGVYPSDRCNSAFNHRTLGDESEVIDRQRRGICSFRWGPQLGVTFAFGGARSRRRSSRPPSSRPSASPGRTPPPPIEYPEPIHPVPSHPTPSPIDPALEPMAVPEASAAPPDSTGPGLEPSAGAEPPHEMAPPVQPSDESAASDAASGEAECVPSEHGCPEGGG